jgi:NAD(P)-dependent dehydrogenase (short-subunit alcohol dehydrogenase family)
VEAAVERGVAELGGLHILVNNAGVARDNLLFRMSDEDWDDVIAVHLRGAFLFGRVPPATPATCGGKATSHPGGRRCGAAT